MDRRTFLTGASIVAGTGAVVASGAFSTASATREMTITVADDANSFLALQPGADNGEYTDTSGDALVVDLSTDGGTIGLGVDTVYSFENIVSITNQGNDAIWLWTSVASAAFDDDALYFYRTDPETPFGPGDAVEVGAGESVSIGLFVDTGGLTSNEYTPTATIEAADEPPTSEPPSEDPPSEPLNNVMLDSVASLLNPDEEPLTDEETIAIWAEQSAENVDQDGNDDAITYPDGTDIPVVGIDGSVVGVTGPFVTTNTDFAQYGNEEFMLNVYDQLLGGSGSILHDEGHGQFYTYTPNGGDDFQAFGDYAADNGYTYEATTDIESDLAAADAVVITSPSEAFTDSERSALSDFVDDGGAIFLHDQSDYEDFDETDNLNAIADALALDFRFNDDQVIDNQNNTGAQYVPTTGNFNDGTFPELFLNRDGLGPELDPGANYEVEVVSVTDGDTADVEFDDGTVDTVRVVGIDTPETGDTEERIEEYVGIEDAPALKDKADEATDFAIDQLDGETVTLSFDESQGLRGDFGRLLGILELPDGTVYNKAVVENGWARVYHSGFTDHDEYWEAEQTAKDDSDGIWELSDPAGTGPIRDEPVEELFVPSPVAVSGDNIPVYSEDDDPLVALDLDANVAAVGGPLIEERFEAAEGGPGIEDYGVFPFLTNVIDTLSDGTGPVVVDGGHGQFGVDYAVSAEDTAYYQRYLEGQATDEQAFIPLEGVVELTSDPGPDLLDAAGEPAALAVILSAPPTALSDAERSLLADYTDAGGAVIALGTAANDGAREELNSVLDALDATVSFTEQAITDETNNLGGDSEVPTTTNFDEEEFGDLFEAFGTDTQPTVIGSIGDLLGPAIGD